MRDQDDDKDIISVSCVDDANVDKEETNNTHKQGDLSIFVRDEHDTLLLDVKLTILSCNRRILKIDSPNGIQLGYVKKGRFSAYEICDANHHSLLNFDMKSKNHEYKAEVTDTKNGNKIAVIKQREIESDILSFQINYKSASTTLQKVLIMVAGISEIQQQQENELCSLARYALFLLAFVIMACLKGKAGKIGEFVDKWGDCIGFMSTIPCTIFENLNGFCDICQ
ncbi:unnamed protein product [Mytilus coruscus]|uniref:Uncharacterized protein n=1 Tax=Mytilus coruscus TaxID=42192 RepID=A0A6J8A4Y2_MYTCO|nr:unnamed protein product [Mytilus coruscus]